MRSQSNQAKKSWGSGKVYHTDEPFGIVSEDRSEAYVNCGLALRCTALLL